MAHSYTPGLKVLHETKVIKERRLPLKGEVVVHVGDQVNPNVVVAKTDLPGNVQMVNVANLLNIDPSDCKSCIVKPENEPIKKDEIFAETKGIFGLFKSNVKAPVDCCVESVSDITGQVVLRESPIPVEVDAYMTGKIKEIIPEEGVSIETDAVFIQGIFGIGGESRGMLVVAVADRNEELTPEMIKPEMKDKIIVGGSFISLEAYQKALKLGLAGVVVGGFNYHDLEVILGYTLGVAITGSENLVTSLIVTEGYGKIAMGSRTYDLLKEHSGKFASINGATQIRAGVIRPEIVIPLSKEQLTGSHKEINASVGIGKGSLVRVIRAPYFGHTGIVKDLPAELQKMESETMVRVAEIEIDGEIRIIPRSNLEMIETD